MPAMLPDPRPALRRSRPWAALGVVALVLWLHGWLIAALAPDAAQRPGERGAAPAALQVRRLAPPLPAPQPEVGTPSGGPPVPVPRAPAPPAPPALRALAPPSPPALAPQLPARADPAAGATVPLMAAAPAPVGQAAQPAVAAATGEGGAPAPAAPAADGAAEPPPVYPTRLPAPVLLRYALRYNGRVGEAALAWRHDGRAYTLALDGQGAAQPLVAQASQGGFDHAGLAPERFLDRRRGTRQQAAHFRRDIGRIAFSGPATEYPAWPGAQDRLSWLPQLAAILAAVAAPPPVVSLFVVDARGAGGLWHLQAQGEVALATALGERPAQLWRREPPRPEGLRVEAWLDAAIGHWPLLLRFTAPRSGDVFELALIELPAPPP